MRIRFVVFEEYVESRFVLLDQVRFEYECLNLIVHNNKLKIRDDLYQLARLRIMISAGVKIRTHAVTQILSLPDIDDLTGSIPMNVDPGVGR